MSPRVAAQAAVQARSRLLALLPVERPQAPGRVGWLPGSPVLDDGEERTALEAAPLSRHAGRARLTFVERMPQGVRAVLVAVERPAVTGLALVGLAAVVLAALVWGMGRPQTAVVAPRVQATGDALAPEPVFRATPSPTPAGIGSAGRAGSVVVDVVGLVRRPGVVTLPGGARVTDAVRAAGGATGKADVSSINLARRLVDGEQIVVVAEGERPPAGVPPLPGGDGSGGSAVSGGSAQSSVPLDLNATTIEQLDGLPGVGPVLAQRILDWRQAHGRFSSVDELREVTGIGSARFEDLKARVRV